MNDYVERQTQLLNKARIERMIAERAAEMILADRAA